MLLIIIAVIGVLLLYEKFAESSNYGFVAGDDSIWHDEYEEEMKNLRKQAKENNITLSEREIDMVANKINKKAKVFERNLCIVFISLCVFTVVKEVKTNVLKCELLQKILFFRFDNNETLEENYKFYLPEENYIKTFS